MCTLYGNTLQYLMRSFGFKRVRHNGITVVFVVDILSPLAKTVALQVKRFLDFTAPLRFGFLFYTPWYVVGTGLKMREA